MPSQPQPQPRPASLQQSPRLLTVTTRILWQLQARPSSCALQFRDRRISNGALLDKVLRLSERLAELDIGSGCRVAVGMERSPEQVVVLLALWQSGAVYVPFDAKLPRERLLDMCSVAEVSVLLTHVHLQATFSSLPVAVVTLADIDFSTSPDVTGDGAEEPARPAAAKVDRSAPQLQAAAPAFNPAYILFTSGSTGLPKGVLITQHNLAALFRSLDTVLPCCAGKRVLACAASSFDIAFYELLAPLLGGGTIVLADQDTSSDPEALTALIISARVDVIQATPSLWQLLNRFDWNPEHRPVLAIATGEALPRSVAATLLRRTPLLWNLYGPTECTIWASAHRVTASDVSDEAPALVAIGTALPHVLLELHHEAGAGVSAGEQLGATRESEALQARGGSESKGASAARGELWIGGEGVGAGYCGAAEATGAAFFEQHTNSGPRDARQQQVSSNARWYRSGDQCARTADGILHFLGRLDSQVKVNGYRIELHEITRLLLQHASILNAACLTRTLPDGRGTLLFACVVFIPGRPNKNRHGLNQYLARFLPAWMLPHRYYFLNELPLTANGKLDRAALLALAAPAREAQAEAASTHAHPDTASTEKPAQNAGCQYASDLDRRVAALFCDVLDISDIGPCDSFLDAGGSSMLSATLVLLLNQRFGTQLSLRQALATPPTVQSIVKLLKQAGV